jgi:hypothetical protein
MPPLALVLSLACCLAAQDRAVDVSVLTLGPPVLVAEVDTGGHGELIFFDRQKVPDVQGAVFPAWSADGSRLAFIRKTGRKKLAISWIAVGR